MKKLTQLSAAQKAEMKPWAEKWIAIGLQTGETDWDANAAAVRECYRLAGLREVPIIRVSSPIVGALTAPLAANFTNSAVYSEVNSDVGRAVYSAIGRAVDSAVGNAVDNAVYNEVYSAVGKAVYIAVNNAVSNAVLHTIGSAISRAGRAVDNADKPKLFWHYWLGGQFWSWLPAFTEFLINKCDAPVSDDTRARSRAYAKLTETASYQWMNRDFCITCARPTMILLDAEGRLHSDSSMAIAWPDGWGLWMIHGVHVTEQIVMRPETLTIAQIQSENNAEVRRVMIDRYGEERYILDSGMKSVAHDEVFGTLYVEAQESGTPIAKIRVINRSPEPDGTFRVYWLNINPAHYSGDAGRIPQAAVASTWRTADGSLAFANWRDYSPQVET